MKKRQRTPGHSPISRVLTIGGLILLGIVTAGVVWVAVTQDTPVDTAGSVPTPATPAVTPEPAPEPEPEPEPVPVPPAPVMQRLLTAGVEPGHLMRATVGSCPDPAGVLEVTFDDGASWQPGVIASVSATRMLQLDMSESVITRMVSLDADCAPQAARSFVGGTSWQTADLAESPWFIDQGDATIVHTPVGAQTLPCSTVGLAASAARAIALCSDATVTVSEDSGASWSAPLLVPYATAVGLSPSAFVIASNGEPDCAGVRTRTLAGSALADPGGCLDVTDGADGHTAVTGNAEVLHIWSGSTFARSTDMGASWG